MTDRFNLWLQKSARVFLKMPFSEEIDSKYDICEIQFKKKLYIHKLLQLQ